MNEETCARLCLHVYTVQTVLDKGVASQCPEAGDRLPAVVSVYGQYRVPNLLGFPGKGTWECFDWELQCFT